MSNLISAFTTKMRGATEERTPTLSELCGVAIDVIDKMMNGERVDPVLILCRAANFTWPSVRNVILVRPGSRGKSAPALDQASANFDKLSAMTAQRVVRFWQASTNPGGLSVVR